MDEDYTWEEHEVRLANGRMVKMVKLCFDQDGMAVVGDEQQVTLLCRRCGNEVTATPDPINPWKHLDGMITCRESAMDPWVPTTTAAPTVWVDAR